MKAQIIERVIKSIKHLIYTYMTDNNTRKWLPKLDLILQSYNTRTHSAHGFSPVEAELPENHTAVLAALNVKFTEAVLKGERRKKNAGGRSKVFRIGDLVRIALDTKTFQRSYKPSFSDELYTIITVDRRQPQEMYRVAHSRTGTIESHDFYATELQLYNDPRRQIIIPDDDDGDSSDDDDAAQVPAAVPVRPPRRAPGRPRRYND